MALVQKITTAATYTHENVLVPAGTVITVDTDVIELTGNAKEDGLEDLPKNYTPAAPMVMAAIGPTGPMPTAPQQLAPGTFQTIDGYASPDGTRVVAEGSQAAFDIEEGGTPTTKKTTAKSKVDEALS